MGYSPWGRKESYTTERLTCILGHLQLKKQMRSEKTTECRKIFANHISNKGLVSYICVSYMCVKFLQLSNKETDDPILT